MEVTHYSHVNHVYRQIIDTHYKPLKELKDFYNSEGTMAWLNLYKTNKWILTVLIRRED